MLVQPVIDRLLDRVEELAGRVETALELADIVNQNLLPQVTPHAYVVPLGLSGGAGNAVTKMFRQPFEEIVGVVLFIQSAGDATGAGAVADLDALSKKIIHAVAGWMPPNVIGAFRLARAELAAMTGGMAIYQINFAIGDQLRIETEE